MFIDFNNLIVEQNFSGGDSAHYSGLLTILSNDKYGLDLHKLVLPNGYCVRHVGDGSLASNNPNNFTRDQLMPLVAGLYVQKKYDIIRKITAQYSRRLFFSQNIERDVPGSRKYPWPHRFINDKGEPEFRWFDYRDPLWPHHIHALIKASNYKLHFLLYPISTITYLLELILMRVNPTDDIGTSYSTGFILGFEKLFKYIIVDWKKRFERYLMGWRQGKIIFDEIK